jgi:CheY-like chemotaxis protein
VLVDPAQLEASLTNLATNARDAMPRGGRLAIATANRSPDGNYTETNADVQPGDYAMIAVSDTGIGMQPEVISRIFDPFYTTKEPGKGTGLGLSMVYGFVKQSGGHIIVHSEPGVGTTFRLYLPRAPIDAAAGVEKSAATPLARSAGETVLAVEDNAAMRRIVLRQLAGLGYRVLEADGAGSALALLERQRVYLLFTDIVMPGKINGFELARQALTHWPSIKVVLTSGFPQGKINGSLGAMASSARLLSKPYRKEELARILREVLDA